MKKDQYSGGPLLFDGTNFSHWKVKMSTYLQTLDFGVWRTVENGWVHPFHSYEVVDDERRLEKTFYTKPKNRSHWSDSERQHSRNNNIGLNAIFMAMNDEKDFRRIRFCKTSKEAWDTLVKAYEWYKDDKETYLQNLDLDFEAMKMEEDERFDDFFLRFQELVNTIGETSSENKYSELEINRKILRSLPPRFWSQRDTNNLELLDLSEMSVDTLVAKLRTCEAEWEFENLQKDNKNKDLAFENSSHSKNSAPYGRCLARYFSMLFRLQKEPY